VRAARATCAALLGLLVLSAAGAATGPTSASPRGEVGEHALYEVRPGDTLWSISATNLGDPTLWAALYHANRDQIKDPTRVYPGQRLAIPTVEPDQRESLRREAEALGAP
jgi:nucleoid-associated protein YgaU